MTPKSLGQSVGVPIRILFIIIYMTFFLLLKFMFILKLSPNIYQRLHFEALSETKLKFKLSTIFSYPLEIIPGLPILKSTWTLNPVNYVLRNLLMHTLHQNVSSKIA